MFSFDGAGSAPGGGAKVDYLRIRAGQTSTKDELTHDEFLSTELSLKSP
jgi:hypothetical protein